MSVMISDEEGPMSPGDGPRWQGLVHWPLRWQLTRKAPTVKRTATTYKSQTQTPSPPTTPCRRPGYRGIGGLPMVVVVVDPKLAIEINHLFFLHPISAGGSPATYHPTLGSADVEHMDCSGPSLLVRPSGSFPRPNLPQTTSHPHVRLDTQTGSTINDDIKPYARLFRPTRLSVYDKMDHTASDSQIIKIINVLESAVGCMISAKGGISIKDAQRVAHIFKHWERARVLERLRDTDAARDQASKSLETVQLAEQQAHRHAEELKQREVALKQDEEALKIRVQKTEADRGKRLRDANATYDQANRNFEAVQLSEQQASGLAAALKQREVALKQNEEALKIRAQIT